MAAFRIRYYINLVIVIEYLPLNLGELEGFSCLSYLKEVPS